MDKNAIVRQVSELCNKCQWEDQCGCDNICGCEDYTPLADEEMDYILEEEYRTVLKERVEDYDELLSEMRGEMEVKEI